MVFRYDTRHLTPQQQAIINQRDEADRIRAEEAMKRKKEHNKQVENEELFVRLCLLHQIDSPETKELIENGYLTKDLNDTNKAKEFKRKFIEFHKDILCLSMKESNNDIPYSMKKAGISDYVSFQFIAEELLADSRFIKNDHDEYRVK